MLTGTGGRLSGEVGVGGCEMPDADELEAPDAPLDGELREVALYRGMTAGDADRALCSISGARCAACATGAMK